MKYFYSFIIVQLLLIVSVDSLAQSSIDTCEPISVDIFFKGKNVRLTPRARAKLDSVYNIMKHDTICKIRVAGHGAANEEDQQISWDKVETVLQYLVGMGIDKNNFVLYYGIEGDPEIVNVASSKEEGPHWIPAPIPCYSLHLPRKQRCVDKHGHLLH